MRYYALAIRGLAGNVRVPRDEFVAVSKAASAHAEEQAAHDVTDW